MLRLLAGGLLALAVGLTAFVMYLQSYDGFTRVVLPLVNGLLPAPIEAARGRLSLGGHLEIDQGRYRDDARGLDIGADRLVGDIDLLSLVSGTPHIRDADVEGLRYQSEPPKGETADDTTAKDEATDDTDESGIDIPVWIDRLRARKAVLIFAGEEAERTTIGPLEIELAGLSPGGSATLDIDGPLLLYAAGEPARDGNVRAHVTLDQDDGGSAIRGKLDTTLAFERTGGGEGGPVEMKVLVDVTAEDPSTLGLTLNLEARREDLPVGTISTQLSFARAGAAAVSEALPLLSASLQIKKFEANTLNPLLVLIDVQPMKSGTLDGELELSSAADNSFEANLRLDGTDIVARVDERGGATPPLQLTARHKGTWKPESRQFDIQEAALHLDFGGKNKIAATLKEPIVLDLGSQDADGALGAGKSAVFTTYIDVHLDPARTWLHALGIRALDRIERGSAKGEMDVEVMGLGEKIAISRKVNLRGIVFKNAGGESIGPLDVDGDLQAVVTQFSRVETKGSRIDVSRARAQLVAGNVAGTLDWQKWSGQQHMTLEVADLGATLSALGFLPAEARKRVRGGRTKVALDVALGAKRPVIDFSAQATVDGLALILDAGREVRESLRVNADLRTGEEGSAVVVRSLVIDVDGPPGTEPMRVAATGSIDASSSQGPGRGGNIDLTVERLALGPWIDAFGGPSLKELGPLPLEAKLTVTRRPDTGSLTISGQEELTLLAGGAKRKLTVTNQVTTVDDKGINFTAELHASSGGDSADEATLKGRFETAGGRRRLVLSGEIRRLDATPYLSPFVVGLSGKSQPPGKRAAPAEPTGGTEASRGSTVDLDLDLRVGSLRFREIDVQSGRVQVSRIGSEARVEVSPTKILNGSMHGKLEQHAGAERRLSWDVAGERLDIGRLTRSLGMTGDRRMEGILRLASSARGAGTSAVDLRQNLKGHVKADMSEAHFTNLPLFTYMAQVTRIPQFENIVFDSFIADIEIGDDLARIKEMEGSGLVANVVADGFATLTGDVDVKVNPRLGPSLSGNLGEIFGVGLLLKTASGFVALPIDVTVRGHYSKLKYGVRARAPGALEKLTGGVVGETTGAAVDAGKKVGSEVLKGLGGLLKGGASLFGKDKDK